MSGDVQLELWLHQYKMDALASVLAEQGVTVEQRMQDALTELYVELVPKEVRQEISAHIKADLAAQQEEIERARNYTAFCVQTKDSEVFFQLDQSKSFLDVAKYLRRFLQQELEPDTVVLSASPAGLKAISAEQYDQLMALRMEAPRKVTGVFDLDFDRKEVSTIDAADGWKTYSMKDVASAAHHAYRKKYLLPEQYESRFLEKLEGKELAGHLSAKDISLKEDMAFPSGPMM